MSNRQSFRFGYQASVLHSAAVEKLTHHTARKQHWQGEREAAEAALRTSGVEFREHQVTGGKQVVAVIDPEKQQWLNTCSSKIDAHHAKAEEYQRWANAFQANLGNSFDLDVDDIAYFGLNA